MDTDTIVEGVVSLFIIAILLVALYPMAEDSFGDLKGWISNNSTNTYVKTYAPKLVDYVPFLFILAILIGLIIKYAKKLKG